MRIISNICSHSGLDQAYAEINVNEKTHAGTYSEIFRLAVPGTYLEHQARIKDFTDSRDRMSVLNKVATECFVATTRYALGDIPYSQQLFNTVFEFMFGLWCMERGQFMSSFAQTFIITGLGETMMPVEAAVQRICNDELTIHAQLGEYVFKTMLESEQGQVAMKECRDDLERIAYMVHSHENRWNSRSLNPLKNRRLYGISIQDLDNWVAVNMAPIYAASGIDPMSYAPDNFTLPIVERLVDIRSSRPASMERNGGLYTVGALTKDTSGPLPNVGGISF
jgi:ribonucleotide reductase beta subunit family protein with ferritin-like domain